MRSGSRATGPDHGTDQPRQRDPAGAEQQRGRLRDVGVLRVDEAFDGQTERIPDAGVRRIGFADDQHEQVTDLRSDLEEQRIGSEEVA